MKNTVATLTACLTTALLLSGCLVPEKFAATVAIHPDASYEYRYTGTVINAFGASEIKTTGVLSPKSDAGLKAEADKMKSIPDVRSASYLGSSRYQLAMEGNKKAGEALKLLDILTVTRDKDGVITIASPEYKDKDLQNLADLGIKIDGTLDIKLPRNAEVLSQNATSTPSFFGLIGGYSWKIGRADQRPMMKIKLKP